MPGDGEHVGQHDRPACREFARAQGCWPIRTCSPAHRGATFEVLRAVTVPVQVSARTAASRVRAQMAWPATPSHTPSPRWTSRRLRASRSASAHSGGPNYIAGTHIIIATTITGDMVCRATNVSIRLDTSAARSFLATRPATRCHT